MLETFFQNGLDHSIAAFFLANRNGELLAIFKTVSLLGNWQIIIFAAILIVIFLSAKDRLKFIAPFVFTIAGTELAVLFSKMLFHRPRPLGGALFEADYSFPSGHAAIAIAFYGSLAYMLAKSADRKYKPLIISLAVLVIALIGFSRIYLGVHYLSDVVAGYLVGGCALAISIVAGKKG